VREYSCGFRAYRGDIVRRAIDTYGNNFIQLKGLGFTCTIEKLVKFKMLNARFAEVPFVLRYDQKFSSSKMVGSVTMLGYFVLTLLYWWPWGGWRSSSVRYRAAFRHAADAPPEPDPTRSPVL
jgi:dolichol-phosphate mannosyltransferase